MYAKGFGMVGNPVLAIFAEHAEEFPAIWQCVPGTFNVTLRNPPHYKPPRDDEWKARARRRGDGTGKYRDGNHVSPLAKVVKINGESLTAWIYRGGHQDCLELLACERISDRLSLRYGMTVTLLIQEFADLQPDMPQPPPCP